MVALMAWGRDAEGLQSERVHVCYIINAVLRLLTVFVVFWVALSFL